ncbi:Uncharacterised protein [Salmonella enterica subsp. enterica]|nr:Uncharacterised protein [Salmonella enterica subsp. enterica]
MRRIQQNKNIMRKVRFGQITCPREELFCVTQHLQTALQGAIHWRFNAHDVARSRMRELQRRGVQKETFKTGSRFGKLLIKLTVAVAIVERNRVTGILGMDANLMRTGL